MFVPLEERVEQEIDQGVVSDVCFGAGPEEEYHLFSSKAVLALASPVFGAMFFAPHCHAGCGGSSSSGSGGVAAAVPAKAVADSRRPAGREGSGYRPEQHTYVAVTDVEPGALRCLLRYVSHLDPGLSLDSALHVYRAADRYQIDGLLGACVAFLDDRADCGNVDQMIRLFDISCTLGLERYACWFLEKLGELSRLQTSRLLHAEEFFAMHSVSLAALLRYDGFVVDEETLWCALRRWAELRASQGGRRLELDEGAHGGAREKPGVLGSGGPASWQELLVPLKRSIRFPTMRASFFAEQVAQAGVLTSKEAVDIFCHLSRPTAQPTLHRGGVARSARDRPEQAEAVVSGAFRTDQRAPEISWCAAPGVSDAQPGGDQSSIDLGVEEASLLDGGPVVMAGSGLHGGPWGPRVILGGSDTKFHFAFGSSGFSSGRHAWTISWRPLDNKGGTRCSPVGRGGAAGLAREADLATAAARFAGGTGPAAPGSQQGTSPAGDRRALTSGGPGGGPASSCSGPSSGDPSDELATRFADWPTCIVFGVKQDVQDRRYVPWEGPVDTGASASATCVKFAIVIDFPGRNVTYLADGGERCWTAPLSHSGAVHPVIAASGPHFFRIQYGVHL